MIRNLTRSIFTSAIYHYRNGVRVEGAPSGLRGNVDGLWGDVSGLRGNVSGLWGDVSDLWGNVSGLRGDVSDLWGDVDACGLTDEDRARGVDVAELITPKPATNGGK
jgi:hypothetical protein